MKKLLALVLSTLLLLLSFTACGKTSPDSSSSQTPGQAGGSSSTPGDTVGDNITPVLSDYDQAIADRSQPVKLVMAALNWVGPMNDQAAVAEAMNAITREKLNIEIELLFMDYASYQQQLTLMLGGGEQLDLFNALVIGYTNVINNGYVIDLEEDDLIRKYGPGIIDLRGDDLDGLRFDGTLYGVPVHKDDAIGLDTYIFGAQYLDDVGFNYEPGKVNNVTQAQVEALMADLKTRFPDQNVIVPQRSSLGQTVFMDDIGSDFFGVLLDPANSLKLSNLFESQQYYDYCNAWYNWKQKGYLAGDALTNEMSAVSQVLAGSALGYKSAMKPGIVAQESNLIGMDAVCLQVGGNFKKSSTFTSMPWTISVNTVDSVAAMQYLNELYTNPELSRLLCWGIEGRHYVVGADGHLTFAEGVTAADSGYLHSVNWEMPNQFIAGIWEGDDLSLWDDMRTFNETASASKAMGFAFNNSSLSTEYTALMNIYNEYRDQLEFGFLDPAVGIPEMVARMNSAGLENYIVEKQAQIDAWASANGIA